MTKINAQHHLTVSDIAGWQVDIPDRSEKSSYRVALPELQRGAVWKPKQVEALWDSLLRGFPIGSFILAPISKESKEKLGARHQNSSQKEIPENSFNYHLLDGQQRSNAMALAFLSPWLNGDAKTKQSESVASLWLDLGVPKEERDDRKYIFRVVTRSHPWGYSRGIDEDRLEVKKRRLALEAFNKFNGFSGANTIKASSVNLAYAWPWDAIAPVPFSFLVYAVREHKCDIENVSKKLLIYLNKLPYWQHRNSMPEFSGFKEVARILENLEGVTPNIAHDFRNLIIAVNRVIAEGDLDSYQVPIQIVPTELFLPPGQINESNNDGRKPAPIETLFIRLNAGGTRLDGEELSYSILKSVWPGARACVDALSTRLMSPSRLVMLASRLLLARRKRLDTPPVSPDVERFSRLMHDKEFASELQRFLQDDEHGMKCLLKHARLLTTIDSQESSTFLLPPVLFADIARHTPDVMFLLLWWLDRMVSGNKDLNKFLEKNRKYLVGTLTSLSWFSVDPAKCLELLWPSLRDCRREELPTFFGVGVLKRCLKPHEGKLALLPLPPPSILKQGIDKRMWGHGLLVNPGTESWKNNWEWERSFIQKKHTGDKLRPWFSTILKKVDADENGEQAGLDLAIDAWRQFALQLWNKRELIIYAQRDWIWKWFNDDFDPASPDQLEDTDRPWDLDHIHPHKYVHNIRNGGNAIRIIKEDWHNSIGNLRAWPFELNRGDGDAAPFKKLTFESNNLTSMKLYGIGSKIELLNASAITNDNVKNWINSTPIDSFNNNYLKDHPEYRPILLRAIVDRMQDLYKGWYGTCGIGDLLK